MRTEAAGRRGPCHCRARVGPMPERSLHHRRARRVTVAVSRDHWPRRHWPRRRRRVAWRVASLARRVAGNRVWRRHRHCSSRRNRRHRRTCGDDFPAHTCSSVRCAGDTHAGRRADRTYSEQAARPVAASLAIQLGVICPPRPCERPAGRHGPLAANRPPVLDLLTSLRYSPGYRRRSSNSQFTDGRVGGNRYDDQRAVVTSRHQPAAGRRRSPARRAPVTAGPAQPQQRVRTAPRPGGVLGIPAPQQPNADDSASALR